MIEFHSNLVTYHDCFSWIQQKLKPLGITTIGMCRCKQFLNKEDLELDKLEHE